MATVSPERVDYDRWRLHLQAVVLSELNEPFTIQNDGLNPTVECTAWGRSWVERGALGREVKRTP